MINAPDNTCFVQLIDRDNYTEDNITIKGPEEFSNLKNLSGADKNWNDKADSFKSGKNNNITFYTETDFKGERVTYEGGTEKPSFI